ncbi:MAG: tRNA lysidine(34) synthetase TilS [Verrucomicrobiota bacterium]
MTDLLQRVEQNIQNHRLIKRNRRILAGVSGGLDSITLLHALQKISTRQKWKIVVAHFNHQLRGRASDADEKLVRKTSAAMNLSAVVERANVREFARKSKLSIEMAARKLRHEFFARVAKKRKIHVVALAHHADDQVELFFLRLLRGAGGEGLAGMKWRSPSPADKKIILVRPLLDVTKSELHGFARENKIHFREDATNVSPDVPRNRVRNELLPLLRENYQPGLAKTVLRLMEIVGAESGMVGKLAEQWLKQHQPDFKNLPVAVQRRVLQSQLAAHNVPADFELVEQLRGSANQFVSVGAGLSVARDTAGAVKLQAQQTTRFNADELTVNLTNAKRWTEFAGIHVNWQFNPVKKFVRPQYKRSREFFDADKVGNEIILRHWRAGDRFQPIGLKSAAKLQDLFTNAKIPRVRRSRLIVAATRDGEIFWVEGLRISENFRLTPRTKRRLIWRWQRIDE